jgi:hypothetical protein
MDSNEELEVLAVRKGFYLTILEDTDVADFVGSKFVLEDAEDDDADYVYFKTELGLRRFLERFPDNVREAGGDGDG